MTPVILMIMKTVVIYRVSCNYTDKLLGMVWDIKIFILYVKNVSINCSHFIAIFVCKIQILLLILFIF